MHACVYVCIYINIYVCVYLYIIYSLALAGFRDSFGVPY